MFCLPNYHLTVTLSSVATVLALCLALLSGRLRPGRTPAPPPEDEAVAPPSDTGADLAPPLEAEASELSEYWEPPARTESDRRRSLRRLGNPVLVDVIGLGGAGGEPGVVIDRSGTGLRLRVARPAKAGTCLTVRAREAADGTPWTALRVRWGRKQGTNYELGGEFVEPPPVNVLLTFG